MEHTVSDINVFLEQEISSISYSSDIKCEILSNFSTLQKRAWFMLKTLPENVMFIWFIVAHNNAGSVKQWLSKKSLLLKAVTSSLSEGRLKKIISLDQFKQSLHLVPEVKRYNKYLTSYGWAVSNSAQAGLRLILLPIKRGS